MSWRLTLHELLTATDGKCLSGTAQEFTGVGTDSRQNLHGQLFIALKGENHDAHNFLRQAVQAGAAGIVVHQNPPSGLPSSLAVVRVEDTLGALQKLAHIWRTKNSAKILAMTGTNGKTTTKEFAAQIISKHRRVQYSRGSFNNHWGVPISLLTIEPEHEVAIIEMGTSGPGEIKTLVKIADPDVVLVTTVGRGHLQGFGSVDVVAQEKQEIYIHARANSLMLFNLDNPYTYEMWRRFKIDRKNFAFSGGELRSNQQAKVNVNFSISSRRQSELGITGVIEGIAGAAIVPVFGDHNVSNLMGAACLALSVGLTPQEIWAALPYCRTSWGRDQWVKTESGAAVLFDGYNANPESMASALESFSRLETTGRKIAFLGEMRELGDARTSMHRELGVKAGKSGFDILFFVGPSKEDFSAGVKASGFLKYLFVSDAYENNLALSSGLVLDEKDIVLVKGSRGMNLERVLDEWKPLDFTAKKS